MHYIFLSEDESGKALLEQLMPQLLPNPDDYYESHSYKGIGRIPPGLKPNHNPKNRALLNNLSKVLPGLRNRMRATNLPYRLIVVLDLDDKNRIEFLSELEAFNAGCSQHERVDFCLAIEEGEAWLLGDREALLQAYPQAKVKVLNSYVQDSICGTWELLADAIYPGGRKKIDNSGKAKGEWARNIGACMKLERNESPSFKDFVHTVRRVNPLSVRK